jgi:Tol biopolymer transport system component
VSLHKYLTCALSAALCVAWLSASLISAQAQGTQPPAQASASADAQKDEKAKEEAAERARNNARNLEQNARTLTLFDRDGKVVATIGERHIFNQPTLSPDRSHIAVIKPDLDKETTDLWAYDIATGKGIQITSNKPREGVQAPAWSPDGRFVAYVALRGSRYNIFRKPADGTGAEEVLFEKPGGPIVLTDWSLDGRYLSFYASDLGGSTLFLMPLDGDRKPFAVAKSDKEMVAARLSPDSRLLAYRSNETGRAEIFVQSVTTAGTQAKVDKWQVSTEGGYGMVWWRRDGQEFYFFGPDRVVMAVQVKTGPGTFEFSKPRPMFKAPDSIPPQSNPGAFGSVSRDGERIVFSVPPPPPLRQLTVFDRQGNIVGRIGPPGVYVQPTVSPDGSKVAVMRQDPQNGNNDIWAFDIATGKGTAVTADPLPQNAPIWFDNNQVGYVATRDTFASVYRKQWTGQGAEEQLFRYTAGAGMVLTDFSPDGRYAMVDGGGIVLAIPLTGTDPLKRQAVDFARSEYEAGAGRFSPDGGLVAFGSNDTGRFEVYIRPFDSKTGEAAGETKWQISSEPGVIGGIVWRNDGRELYFHVSNNATNEIKVMAVDITAAPQFKASTPRELFRLKGPLPGNPPQWKHITPDGQRFVFAVPVPANSTR